MRLTINHTKSGDSFYVIRSVKRNGKRSSETVKRLGTANEIKEKYGVDDAEAWARDHEKIWKDDGRLGEEHGSGYRCSRE